MERYFAYGSNMDKDDLDRWCNSKHYSNIIPRQIFPAEPLSYKLTFNYSFKIRKCGVANIMENNNKNVFGLLMEITDKDLDKIRKKEGCPDFYEEIEVDLNDLDGKSIGKAITYKVLKNKEKSCHQPPTKEYLDLIISNAKKYHFPCSYIEELNKIKTVN